MRLPILKHFLPYYISYNHLARKHLLLQYIMLDLLHNHLLKV